MLADQNKKIKQVYTSKCFNCIDKCRCEATWLVVTSHRRGRANASLVRSTTPLNEQRQEQSIEQHTSSHNLCHWTDQSIGESERGEAPEAEGKHRPPQDACQERENFQENIHCWLAPFAGFKPTCCGPHPALACKRRVDVATSIVMFLGSEFLKKFGFMRDFIGDSNQMVVWHYRGLEGPKSGMRNIVLHGEKPFCALVGFKLDIPVLGYSYFDYYGLVRSDDHGIAVISTYPPHWYQKRLGFYS